MVALIRARSARGAGAGITEQHSREQRLFQYRTADQNKKRAISVPAGLGVIHASMVMPKRRRRFRSSEDGAIDWQNWGYRDPLAVLPGRRRDYSKAEVKKALDELKRQLGEKVIDVEPDRVELLEADQDGAIQH